LPLKELQIEKTNRGLRRVSASYKKQTGLAFTKDLKKNLR